MAANMKAVKLRMKSIQSTMQITKAMELVASSKLRRPRNGRCQPSLFSDLKGYAGRDCGRQHGCFIGLYQIREK